MKSEILILGSGTSMGVPTLGCACPVCTSSDPRNTRSRPSIAVQWNSHTVVIDTGQDCRPQFLGEDTPPTDAVLSPHPPAGHIPGMDDLRPLSFQHRTGLPPYADDTTT